MIASLGAELRRAQTERRALIGFSIYNLEQGLGVIRAAESEGVPVLLQAGSSAFRYAGREPLARLALGLAEHASVPVGIHLDHATDVAEIDTCLSLGYTSVMFDGSALPIEQNVYLTCEVVKRAHRAGAWVEAELVGIAGDEDSSTETKADALTDPRVAAQFVSATGVDALAIAIGNVHGMRDTPGSLDVHHLAKITEAVAVPLVLHGASGVPDENVRRAIGLGVAKLNVNTELRHAFRQGWLETVSRPPVGDGLAAFLEPAIESTRRAAQEKLCAFSVSSIGVTANGEN